jgi:predicted Fe-Mo cluster-binding NifX family protein
LAEDVTEIRAPDPKREPDAIRILIPEPVKLSSKTITSLQTCGVSKNTAGFYAGKSGLQIMKIAVTSTGKDLNADMDPRFGRAAYFIIVDPETLEYEAVDNKQNLNLPQGAGIQASKTIIENNVEALITGFCGPKAFMVLDRVGVNVLTGAKGRVIDAVHQYKNGELGIAREANVEGHWV